MQMHDFLYHGWGALRKEHAPTTGMGAARAFFWRRVVAGHDGRVPSAVVGSLSNLLGTRSGTQEKRYPVDDVAVRNREVGAEAISAHRLVELSSDPPLAP